MIISILIVLISILYVLSIVVWDSIPDIKHSNFTVIEIYKTDKQYFNDCFDKFNERRAFNDAESSEPVSKVQYTKIF